MRRKKNRQVIKDVVPGGIAQELGLAPGDVLLSINGQSVRDVLDYQYLCQDAELLVLVQKADGEEWELEIEKAYDEDLGIVFENAFMDAYHSCRNKCIFASSTRCRRGCARRFISKMTTRGCLFCKGIISRSQI